MKWLFIIVTSIYVINGDSPKTSLVILEYSDYSKDIVVIPRKMQYDSEYIYKAVEPIIERKNK
jgi:hypothetical protein